MENIQSHKQWKKAIIIVWRHAAQHKCVPPQSSIFSLHLNPQSSPFTSILNLLPSPQSSIFSLHLNPQSSPILNPQSSPFTSILNLLNPQSSPFTSILNLLPSPQSSPYRYANLFLHPVREEDAPGYKNVILRCVSFHPY